MKLVREKCETCKGAKIIWQPREGWCPCHSCDGFGYNLRLPKDEVLKEINLICGKRFTREEFDKMIAMRGPGRRMKNNRGEEIGHG